MKPYSMDLRERVLRACDAGAGTRAVAGRFAVSESWARRLKQRRRDDGRTAPTSPRDRRVPELAAHADRIRELIAATPDLTLAELRAKLGVAVAPGTLWAAAAGLGLTVKKESTGRPRGTGPT